MMNNTIVRLTHIIAIFIYSAYIYRPSEFAHSFLSESGQIPHLQEPKSRSKGSQSTKSKVASDSAFTLKIENEKRVVDEKLKAKLTREIKAAIAKHQLKKPYKIAMGFTKGARDVETFLFGEQIFYNMAESGFTITGTPLDMPDEASNPIPQIKVINNIIYVIISKL